MKETKVDKGNLSPNNDVHRLEHVFKRIDSIAMCVNGKVESQLRDEHIAKILAISPFIKKHHLGYTGVSPRLIEDMIQDALYRGRVKQIKAGAKLDFKYMKEHPAGTIKGLFKFNKAELKRVGDRAEKKAKAILDKSKQSVKSYNLQKSVFSGIIQANQSLLKDLITVNEIEGKGILKAIKEFEHTQGGTAGVMECLPDDM